MKPMLGLLSYRPLRFLFAAAINTGFGYAAFFVAMKLGLSLGVALFVGTMLGIAFNFVSTGGIVFGSLDPRRLPAFCVLYATLFVINLFLLQMLVVAGVAPALAQALLLGPLAALSYFAQRDVVFKARAAGGADPR